MRIDKPSSGNDDLIEFERNLDRYRNQYGNLLILLLSILWAVFVLVGYFYVHKPITASQIVALGNVAASLFVAISLACFAGGLGDFVLPATWLQPLERFTVQAALGTGILGLAWLGIGLSGGYSQWIAWGILFTGLVLLRIHIIRWSGLLKELPVLWRSSSLLGKTLSVAGGFFALVQLVYALAPPVQWDALTYHLELPRRYLEAGRFILIPWNPYWGNPQLGEMVYTWATALGGLSSATVFSWLIFTFLVIGLLGTVSRRVGFEAAWVAVISVLVSFSFRKLMSSGYVDGIAGLIGYCALVSFIEWSEHQVNRKLFLAGLFTGIASFVKLTAGILLPALAVCIFIFGSKGWKAKTKGFALIIIASVAIFLPWILINFVYTGNPLYPYFFTTNLVSPDRMKYFSGVIQASVPQPLLLPLAITWYGVDTVPVAGMPTYASDIGPLLLLFALPGAIFGMRKQAIRIAVICLAAGWVGMAMGGAYSPLLWQTRLYLALLPAAVLLVGEGWDQLSRIITHGIRLKRVMTVLIFVMIGLSMIQDGYLFFNNNPMQTWFRSDSREAYLERAMGWYPAAMQAVRNLPEGSSTLFLWEPRGLFAPSSALPDSWIDRWYLDRQTNHEPGEILNSWRQQGFNYLLLFRDGANFERQNRTELNSEDWLTLDLVLKKTRMIKSIGGSYELYALTP